jgi:Glycosyl hydrolase family 46
VSKKAPVPTPEEVNQRLLNTGRANLEQLEANTEKLKARLADPDYKHAINQAKGDEILARANTQHAILEQEIAIRERLAAGYEAKNPINIESAKVLLAEHRAANPKYYTKKEPTGAVCTPCVVKEMDRMSKVQRPANEAEALDGITGVFEGRIPDYCAVADSPTDAGGLSYGKHQAAEKKGGLYKMLKGYSDQTDPAPIAATKEKIDKHLALFSKSHNSYDGSATQRKEFKETLKSACADPAMKAAQDKFFYDDYMKPALEKAEATCVGSSLGKSMYYDIAIQSGPGRISSLSKKAMATLKSKSTQVQPCDPNGPTEDEFLQAMNDERRKFVTGLGGDAAKSTYREDFYDTMLSSENTSLAKDFVVKGVPFLGLGR